MKLKVPVFLSVAFAFAGGACQLDGNEDPPDGETSETIASSGLALAEECVWAPAVVVTPSEIPPTPTGVPVTLEVAVTNNNPASCDPISVSFDVEETGLLIDVQFVGTPPTDRTLASGVTARLAVTLTAPASADGGDVIPVILEVSEPAPPPPEPAPPVRNEVEIPEIPFTVASQPGCQVSTSHSLMITNLSVVEDPVRTVFDPASRDARNGVWTFKRLAEGMARRAQDAPAMVEDMLASFVTPQTINGFNVAVRAGVQTKVLDVWPRTADGALDLARAPVHLLAIVNRFDLRNLAAGDAGEGRFVFAFNLEPQPGAPPPEATIIFEYKLPAANVREAVRWADDFHRLGSLPFGEEYNRALQTITERFVRRGARRGFPNGSAIHAVRTNEIPLGDNGLWELREFRLSAASGLLEPTPLELTPDIGFNNGDTLAAYINANQAQIIAERHTVPDLLNGQPFKAGAVFNDLLTWFAPGIDNEARHRFAINTCNGCHAAQETGAVFLHLAPREPGTESRRSGWLTGAIVEDPVTGDPRLFDDLGRRKADLKTVVCRGSTAAPLELSQGIRRVH